MHEGDLHEILVNAAFSYAPSGRTVRDSDGGTAARRTLGGGTFTPGCAARRPAPDSPLR
jgi:hypothetical protein